MHILEVYLIPDVLVMFVICLNLVLEWLVYPFGLYFAVRDQRRAGKPANTLKRIISWEAVVRRAMTVLSTSILGSTWREVRREAVLAPSAYRWPLEQAPRTAQRHKCSSQVNHRQCGWKPSADHFPQLQSHDVVVGRQSRRGNAHETCLGWTFEAGRENATCLWP